MTNVVQHTVDDPVQPVSDASGLFGLNIYTVFNQMLNCRDDRRVTLIGNDMSKLTAIAGVIDHGGARLMRTNDVLVDQSRGLIGWRMVGACLSITTVEHMERLS